MSQGLFRGQIGNMSSFLRRVPPQAIAAAIYMVLVAFALLAWYNVI